MALVVPKLPAEPLPCGPLRSEQASLTIKNNSNIPITVASHPQLSVITVQPNTKTELAATIGQTFQVTSQREGQTRNVKVNRKNELLVIDSNRAFTDRVLSSSNEQIRLYPLSSFYGDLDDIKSIPSDITTDITFTNESAENVDVKWIDYKGQRQLVQTLTPKERYKQETFINYFWEAKVVINGNTTTQLFLPTAEADYIAHIGLTDKPVLVPIRENIDDLVSTNDGSQTSISFSNFSNNIAIVYWIDHEKQPQAWFTLHPGYHHLQTTLTTFPWKVTAGSETTYYLPVQSDANVYIVEGK